MTMWVWFLAAAMVLTNIATVLICLAISRMPRRARPEPARSDGLVADLGKARRDLATLVGQLDAVADDFDAKLADRCEALRGLIAEADARLAELTRAAAASPSGRDPATRRRGAILDLAARGVDPITTARRLGVDVGEVELTLNLQHSAQSTDT